MPRSGSMPLNQAQPGRPVGIPNGTNSPIHSPAPGQGSPNMPVPPNGQARQTSYSSQSSARVQSTDSTSNMPTPQTVQQPPTPSSQALANGAGQANQPTWQREFNNIVDLIGSQPNKHYVASPPELEMILARTSAGALPK
jgi:CCR4-NOT transcriptional complex subunit CAF120